LVIAVVVYAAITMLRSAMVEKTPSVEASHAEA
jgi:hypothetical protein